MKRAIFILAMLVGLCAALAVEPLPVAAVKVQQITAAELPYTVIPSNTLVAVADRPGDLRIGNVRVLTTNFSGATFNTMVSSNGATFRGWLFVNHPTNMFRYLYARYDETNAIIESAAIGPQNGSARPISLRIGGAEKAAVRTNGFYVTALILGGELRTNWPAVGEGSGIDASTATGIAQTVATSYGYQTAAQAGQIATNVAAALRIGSWPCVEIAVTAANSTVSLSTSNKAYHVTVVPPGTITNWAVTGVSTASLDWCAVVLEPGPATDFSWKGLRTNVAAPAAYSTNVYFPWRGPGSDYWTVD